MNGEDLNDISELHPVLDRAWEKITEMETENFSLFGAPQS